MILPVTIGKTSNNEVLQVDLCELPHLFITYSEPSQLTVFYADLLKSIFIDNPGQKTNISFSLSKEMKNVLGDALPAENIQYRFVTNDDAAAATGSKYLFLQALMKELKRREKKWQQSAEVVFTPMLILVEDILELVITTRKYTGLYFLELLIAGKKYRMHFVTGSIRTQHNLMKQLTSLHSNTIALLEKRMPGTDFSLARPLGSELIITPEDLYFFKDRDDHDYTRYFKVREGLIS